MARGDALLKSLNDAQRAAVTQTDGPLLVIAGPGTGKTQLLSTRVAYILETADASAHNILCLTFTESAAAEMRERLLSLIGDAAYDVKIATYHSFGSEIIKQYPEYFDQLRLEYGEDIRLERPIDDLSKLQIVSGIVENLDHTSPMYSSRYFVRDVIATISELKRALLTPERLRAIADENLETSKQLSTKITIILDNISTFPRTYKTAAPLYESLLAEIREYDSSLANLSARELEVALEIAANTNSSSPLTNWKNSWLIRTKIGSWVFSDTWQSKRLYALADVLQAYDDQLRSAGLYDFDDMILRAIDVLRSSEELRLTLQEKFLYILLDEFQDTNAAQFELVKLLSDSIVHEGRPNIMAVGDDDQAIYAFQGAESSNMTDFLNSFRDVTIVNLEENYRSHQDILTLAAKVAEQIDSRLTNRVPAISKELRASGGHASVTITRNVEHDEHSEYSEIAQTIESLIAKGAKPSEIGVLAPRHQYLERLVPYLNQHQIPVTYEKRENILTAPVVIALEQMSRLLLALHQQNHQLAAQYFPNVLGLPFWEYPIEAIWRTNWQYAKRDEKRQWHEIAIEEPVLADAVRTFLALALRLSSEPMEHMLDYLLGSTALGTVGAITIPLKAYYFETPRPENEQTYFETLTQLSVIRDAIREYQQSSTALLKLDAFVSFIDMYEQSGQPLMNSHPIAQATEAVKLMTVYKAKGLEFEHVFLINAQDSVWGLSARTNQNKLSLPANLRHIRYGGADNDELLRLFFVGLTRAKTGLHISSHLYGSNGKPLLPLRYLQEHIDRSGTLSTEILPDTTQLHVSTAPSANSLKETHMSNVWQTQQQIIPAHLDSLLKERLSNYRMSPTHLNTFIDLEYGGPDVFLQQTILRFPHAPLEDGEYGNAIHETLEWYHKQKSAGKAPTIASAQKAFIDYLHHKYIAEERMVRYEKRGKDALDVYLTERGGLIASEDQSEYDFRPENVHIEEILLTGKIDRLIIDKANKKITVIDYKTGEAFDTWNTSELKLIKYRQQLYIYKLLVEHSQTFRGYEVTAGILEFIEPDREGQLHTLELLFNKDEFEKIKLLATKVYRMIVNLQLPDTSEFEQSASGSKKFIESILQ